MQVVETVGQALANDCRVDNIYFALSEGVLIKVLEETDNRNLTKRNAPNNCRSLLRRYRQYQVAQHGEISDSVVSDNEI